MSARQHGMVHLSRAAVVGALLVGVASAADVKIALVTPSGGKTVSIQDRQAMWRSPFGGWGVTTWPFSLKVDDIAIFEYQSADVKLQDKAMAAVSGGGVTAKTDAALDAAFGLEGAVKVEDLINIKVERSDSESVELGDGPHTIQPFGLEFTVAQGGTLTTRDPRMRVDSKTRRVEVICHPVTVKMIAGENSTFGRMTFMCGSRSLMAGLDSLFDDLDKQNKAERGSSAKVGFRRVIIYLPASAPGAPYELNGVKFELDAEGRVKLAADAPARVKDGREIQLERGAVSAPAQEVATRALGVSWFGARGEVSISAEGKRVVGTPMSKREPVRREVEAGKSDSAKEGGGDAVGGCGSAWLPISAGGVRSLQLGNVSVKVPPFTAQWPHGLVIWAVGADACWMVELPPLSAPPGGAWACRITRVAGQAAIPASLKVRLEALAGAATGGEMSLTAAGGVFSGKLPAAAGMWRLEIADGGGPLNGQTLGLVMIGGEPAVAVSLFNFRNRGIVLRGDGLDILWVAKRSGPAAVEWPVILRGECLATTIAKIAIPKDAAAGGASGAIRLETAALGPGAYEVSIGDPAVACYPMQFRVVQREFESDFEVTAFFPYAGPSTPFFGSPVLSYRGQGLPGEGLAPFLDETDSALDAALASYADAPAGPVLDKFDHPGAEEKNLMALAAIGQRFEPQYPCMFSQEDRNPKHTLPEDLQEMRRRMALVMQPQVDVPGVRGYISGWMPTVWGFWEDSPCLDGHQGRRKEEANKWAGNLFGKYMQPYNADKLPEPQKKELGRWQGGRAWGSILSHAYNEWLVDARELRSGLTFNHIAPTFWGYGGVNYPPAVFAGLSHRNALDYSDYCIQAWQNFIATPLLQMGNQAKQKTSMVYFAHAWRAEQIPLAFGAAGRGIDGFSQGNADTGDAFHMCKIFSRFGSWFTALDPLPDVAIYWNENGGIAPALHDLARLRRPGMVLAPEDVLAGELAKYKVLMLLGVQAFETPEIEKAVRDFEAKGGVIVKDAACASNLPGRLQLGFEYAKKNHNAWGLSSDGEFPFAAMWSIFKGNEKTLTEVFAKTPPLPVTTSDATVIISPLAGKDSILCFTINQTLVPEALPGRWRQYVVLPKMGELLVDKGWYIHDVLAGKAAPVKSAKGQQSVAIDFTRMEGAIYLLTKREPKSMAIHAERTAPSTVRLTGWLAGDNGTPLADPMPFEVTLKGPGGATLFHKFAALGPDVALEVPVPAMAADGKLELVARDLILGSTAVQPIAPASPAAIRGRATPDLIGGSAKIKAFLGERKGPVTVILGENQSPFRPAAEKMVALLKKSGREARVVTMDLADVLPLTLRWKWTPLEIDILENLKGGKAMAWRVGQSPYAVEKIPHDHPNCGYDEYGPRLRHDADVVLFGSPANHRVLADLAPYLRRVPSSAYPAPGSFFVHYLYSPFLGGYDGLYIGCPDAAGADEAMACLATVTAPAAERAPKPEGKPVTTRGGAPTPLENMIEGKFGVYVLDAAFAPSGKKMYLTTTSYGDWFYIFNQAGEVIEKRTPPTTEGFPNWYQWGRNGLKPVGENTLRIGLWTGESLYDLDKGFISRSPGQPSSLLPGSKGGGPVVSGSTRLEDWKTGITFLGGNDNVMALDKNWGLLWKFDDLESSGDVTRSRGTFVRGISGNGRVLLVSAFGIAATGNATHLSNPSIYGLDTATGKLLWQRKDVFLSEGKAVCLNDRFLVFADKGGSIEVVAADGSPGKALRDATGRVDWAFELPGRAAMLVVENGHFDREGPSARVCIRKLDGSGAQDLRVLGRVTDVALAPDQQSFLISTARGRTMRFITDGTLQWQSETPAAHLLRWWPDGRTVVVGTFDGNVYFLDSVDGKRLRRIDMNSSNVVTPEGFVKQKTMGAVPQDSTKSIPVPPPKPSYLDPKVISPKNVSFGPNLAPADGMRKLLKPAAPNAAGAANVTAATKPGYLGIQTEPITLTLAVEAGTTYLVELINGVVAPEDHTPPLRFEIAVTGKGMPETKNLPVTIRLPVDTGLVRHRTAFRADARGNVTLTMRGVLPVTTGEGKNAKTTYETAKVPLLVGDVVVAAIRFTGRNLLFDGGPEARSNPAGRIVLTGYPYEDGVNTDKIPFHNPAVSLRLVNGLIANQPTEWAGYAGVEYGEAVTEFEKPKVLSAVIVYEDVTAPERTTYRFKVEAWDAKGRWMSLGTVSGNRSTINVFPCPTNEITRIRCVWPGHHDYISQRQTDGSLRCAQIEAYAAESVDVDDLLKSTRDDGIKLDDGNMLDL